MLKKIFLLGAVFLSVHVSAAFAQVKTEQEYLKAVADLIKAGKINESTLLGKELIRQYPQSVLAHVSVANIYRAQGLSDQALDQCQQAIALIASPQTQKDKDDLYQAYRLLGTIYNKQKKNEPAINAFEKAVQLKPDADSAYYVLGILYSLQGNQSKAKAALQRVVEIGDQGESKGALTAYAQQVLKGK